MKGIVKVSWLIFGVGSLVGQSGLATIYEQDSFKEVFEVADPEIQAISESVAVLVNSRQIVPTYPTFKTFRYRTLRSSNVCEFERFVDQPSVASCTGTLISPKHILTASHCYSGIESVCASSKWVFNFRFQFSEDENIYARPDTVYSCKRIVSGSYNANLDYLIVELDRPVLNKVPVEVDIQHLSENTRELFAITAPRGLPLKFSSGTLRSNTKDNYFVSNIDLMRGSSGGPVFDARTKKLVGVVAQGDHDYTINESPFCNAFNRCPADGCKGEYATRASRIPNLPAIINEGFSAIESFQLSAY